MGRFISIQMRPDKGVGAVLSQEQDGRKVVLAYASRTLSKPKRNYDVTRRKLLAVVFGLKTYRQYLLGRQFVKLSLNSFLLSSFIVRRRDIRMQTRSRGDLSWMIVSRVMIRVKTKFVELSLWVPDQLTQVVER